MRFFTAVILATGMLWSVVCGAHAHLTGSAPADHAELATAPKEVLLNFAEPVAMTAAKLESPDGTKAVLKPLPEGAATQARIPLPVLGAGRYRLLWRATSDDGHVMSGELSFVVTGAVTR